jgi:GNAT acetyltransferase-like protein
MDDRESMRIHVEALFTRDSHGDLVRINEPNGSVAPRFFLGQTAHGDRWWFRHDVSPDLRAELEAAIRRHNRSGTRLESPIDPAPYQAILARSAPIQHTEDGPAYTFARQIPQAIGATRVTEANADILTRHLAPWLPDVRLSQPLFVVTCDGHAVSVCASVRQTSEAYEAGVETAVAYRGRGFAAPAVAAWATAVRAVGRVPLYSTSWKNTASQAVAHKLALIQFGNDLHIT